MTSVKILTLIRSHYVSGSLASTKLFTISEDPRTGPAPCCSGGPGTHVKTCVGVEVHPEVLRSRGNITVEGLEGEITTLQFSNTIPPRGSVYKVVLQTINRRSSANTEKALVGASSVIVKTDGSSVELILRL